MKVSNALKFAGNELPCFVVLFHEDTASGTYIYAVHYWSQLIERALRRGRTASANNVLTHKTTMTINFCEPDNHTEDLLTWLISTVRALPETYASDKRKLYETIGYTGARNCTAKVIFGPLKGIEDLVDHHLGLIDSLPVKHIVLTDSRFGIDAPQPSLEHSAVEMQLRPTESKICTLVLQAPGGEFVSLPGEVRFPFVPGLPEDKFKFSITTWMLALTISHTEATEFLLIDYWNTKFSLERLVDLSRFLSWTSGSISITVTAENLPPLSFEGIASSEENTAIFAEFINVTTMLLRIQSRSGSVAGNFSLLDLANCWKDLKSFFLVLCADDMRLRILPISPCKPGKDLSYATGYFDFEVCEITFMVLFDTAVTVKDVGEEGTTLTVGSRMLRECFVGSNGQDVRTAGRECYAAKERANGDDYLNLGDIRQIFKN